MGTLNYEVGTPVEMLVSGMGYSCGDRGVGSAAFLTPPKSDNFLRRS